MGTGRLRGALVGFGNMAENGHLPGWLKHRRVSLVAVCDPDRRRRRQAQRLLPEAGVYASLDDLLRRESLDFVDICTPPPSHAPCILTALNHDLHVLCEKPFVGSTSDLKRISRLCEKKKRIAFPVHNWKHAPILARLLNWVREGRLGRVLYSEFHTLRTSPAPGLTPWRGEKENPGGGGILLDHGWHVAYILMNIHGQAPRSVSAWMHPSPEATGEAEQSAHLLLEFPSSTASMFLTWKAGRRYNSARVYGETGLAVVEDRRLTLYPHEGPSRTAAFREPLSHGSHHPSWFDPVLEGFLHAMDRHDEARREMEEAGLCLEIIRKGYDSARQGGRRVSLATTPPATQGPGRRPRSEAARRPNPKGARNR